MLSLGDVVDLETTDDVLNADSNVETGTAVSLPFFLSTLRACPILTHLILKSCFIDSTQYQEARSDRILCTFSRYQRTGHNRTLIREETPEFEARLCRSLAEFCTKQKYRHYPEIRSQDPLWEH